MTASATLKADERYMRLAVNLAKKAVGFTHPNPLVGCVVVKHNKIIAKGYHHRYGFDHAEVDALKKIDFRADGSTAYVNLEPCAHQGKTPPCVDALIRSQVKRVVIGCLDPNPKVNSKGVKLLRKAGIKVEVGVLESECQKLNLDFFHWVKTKQPYVALKIAQTLDGKIADRFGDSKWISSESSRRYAHQLRALSDAIVTGVGTVIKDDPILNVRAVRAPNPLKPIRVILDTHLKTPLKSRLFSKQCSAPVILFCSDAVSVKKINVFKGKAKVVPVKTSNRSEFFKQAMSRLGAMGITRVLVEAGGQVIGSAIESGCAQEAVFFVAPKLSRDNNALSVFSADKPVKLAQFSKLKLLEILSFDQDVCLRYQI